MSQGGNSLHFDYVPFFKLVVEDPRGVNDLPTEVLVIHVPYVKRLGRESPRLNLDVVWASSSPNNEVTTSHGAAFTGQWGFYSRI